MKTEVLIIGGGLTARRAAEIVSKKHSVTLVCDGAGASPYIHGLNVPLLDADSTELFLRDTVSSGRGQNDTELARALCEGAQLIKNELGDRFDRREDGSFDLLKPLGSSIARVAGIGGRTGAVLLSELKKTATYREICDTRALSLIVRDGAVLGARVFDKKRRIHYSICADAVLVATGGFGGIFRFSTNSPDIGGDGAAMLLDAGAPLVDMEFIQYEPTVALSPERLVGKSIITTMLFEGAVIRNAKGERFMDEKVGKDALSEGISRELLRGGGTEKGGVFYDMSAVPEDMLLGKYKDYYQRYAAASIDIRKTPVEISPAPHTTMGGALINPRCESEIRGLFVAGEAAGGLHGANRLGGNAGLEVLVFGDIAGGAICDFLAQKLDTGTHLCDDEGEIPDAPFDSSDLKERLYEICDKALGVVKNERDLSWALAECQKLVKQAAEHEYSYSAKRLYNDALTAEAVIIAALERRSSVGAHIREDGISESEKYRLVLRKNNGIIKPERQAIK